MAKKITDMSTSQLENIIARVTGDEMFRGDGKIQKLTKVVQKLLDKAWEEGIEQGQRFE